MNHRTTVFPLIAIAVGMLMLTYAAVPLYRVFCKVTGFGGTPQQVAVNHTKVSARSVTVRFNADVDPHLPWKFEPVQKSVKMHLGENTLVAFRATNLSAEPTRGRATYNITPYAAGPYFDKIQCFCFTEQRLGPNQSAILPVSFYVDPAILDDPEVRDVTNITLSYTFFSYDSANKSKLRE